MPQESQHPHRIQLDKGAAAPGAPGEQSLWAPSDKTAVGASIEHGGGCRFNINRGILNEVYFPDVDRASLRDLGFLVTDDRGFISDEKHDTLHEVQPFEDGALAYRVINTCLSKRYRIEKEIVSDPRRAAILQRIRFVPLSGSLKDYHLYLRMTPRLSDHPNANCGYVGSYKETPLLLATEASREALTLVSSVRWRTRTVGFVGASDLWQELLRDQKITQTYVSAENGHVALGGELDLSDGGEIVLALAFGETESESALTALLALRQDFDVLVTKVVEDWRRWHRKLLAPPSRPQTSQQPTRDLYRTSAAVLRAHQAQRFPGAAVASLSIPWGGMRQGKHFDGYHLVWTRDLVEIEMGRLAIGDISGLRDTLLYLHATQEKDGHWPQMMWLDGRPFEPAVQMDEIALPVLLVGLADREGLIEREIPHGERPQLLDMIRRAARAIIQRGPSTQQDRWENESGYSPYTIATEIAALVTVAEFAERNGEAQFAEELRSTADSWNDSIERWTYVTGTELARRVEVDGYYIRIAPPDLDVSKRLTRDKLRADEVVSPDALALVRFGLRDAKDPRILSTLKVIDAILRVDTPQGQCWHRYNGDAYGEHNDGTRHTDLHDQQGHGRAWPLLTGERGHYELARGDIAAAAQMLSAMEGFASEAGMLPEQVWDAPAIPEHDLHPGRPSGSAMPLAWAHAEYLRLRRSIADGEIFDLPRSTRRRYASCMSSDQSHKTQQLSI